MRLSSLLVVPFFVALTVAGCSDDSEPSTDPVTGEAAAPTEDGTTPQPPDDSAAAAAMPAQEEELPGALTDDPFGAPQTPGGAEEAPSEPAAADGTAPVPPPSDYSEAFESDIDYDSPQQGSASATDAAPVAASGKAATADKSGKRVTRYVNALLLNVRSKPSLKAPVVRRLLGGARIEVELHGQFAKLKNGQWCSTRFLSEAPTRKVSRAEVDQAWKQGKSHAKGKGKKKGKKKGGKKP